MTTLCTIGFAGKSLEEFIVLLRQAAVERLIDVRLRPSSQLSGFARQADLKYVLERYEGIQYVHAVDLAPTPELLDGYRVSKDWSEYEAGFRTLMVGRSMVAELHQLIGGLERIALLCSEAKPDKCHRRLLAESYETEHSGSRLVHL